MLRFALLPLTLFTLAAPARAQVNCNENLPPLDNGAASVMSVPDFVRTVLTKEATFAKTFATFQYTADVSVQTIEGDSVDGEFRQIATVDFDPGGARRVTRAPPTADTLKRLVLTSRDHELLVTPPFALTSDAVADRDAVYSGRQRLGDHNAAVFDLMPRNEQAPFHGFAGRAWAWVGGDVVLRTCGRNSGLPIGQMRWDVQRIEVGKNWFPLSIRADETARVGEKDIHVRVTVRYSDYKPR